MLIRSQDRTKLVDIAGKTIAIRKVNDARRCIIEIVYANSSVVLGSYKNKEDTFKVLDLVGHAYNNFETGFCCDIFQMPRNEVVEKEYEAYKRSMKEVNNEE